MKRVRNAKTAAGTERIARELARSVVPPLVILLEGELGAGKTTFARGFVRALKGGDRVVVQSPTYALARTYATDPPVHHLDLYRLEGAGGLLELGLLDLLADPGALSLVEWPRDLDLAGAARVARVLIEDHAGGRRITLDVPDQALTPAKVRSSGARTRRA